MQNNVNEYNAMLSLATIEMQGFNKNYEDYLKALSDANETFDMILNGKKEKEYENVENQIVKALFNKVNKLKKAIVYVSKLVKKYEEVLKTYPEKDGDLLNDYKKAQKQYNQYYADLENKFNKYLLDCISYLDLTTGDIFKDTHFDL